MRKTLEPRRPKLNTMCRQPFTKFCGFGWAEYGAILNGVLVNMRQTEDVAGNEFQSLHHHELWVFILTSKSNHSASERGTRQKQTRWRIDDVTLSHSSGETYANGNSSAMNNFWHRRAMDVPPKDYSEELYDLVVINWKNWMWCVQYAEIISKRCDSFMPCCGLPVKVCQTAKVWWVQ